MTILTKYIFDRLLGYINIHSLFFHFCYFWFVINNIKAITILNSYVMLLFFSLDQKLICLWALNWIMVGMQSVQGMYILWFQSQLPLTHVKKTKGFYNIVCKYKVSLQNKTKWKFSWFPVTVPILFWIKSKHTPKTIAVTNK